MNNDIYIYVWICTHIYIYTPYLYHIYSISIAYLNHIYIISIYIYNYIISITIPYLCLYHSLSFSISVSISISLSLYLSVCLSTINISNLSALNSTRKKSSTACCFALRLAHPSVDGPSHLRVLSWPTPGVWNSPAVELDPLWTLQVWSTTTGSRARYKWGDAWCATRTPNAKSLNQQGTHHRRNMNLELVLFPVRC